MSVEIILFCLLIIACPVACLLLDWYRKETLKLHELNIRESKRSKVDNIIKSLHLNTSVLSTTFLDDKGYSFSKLDGTYSEKNLIYNNVSYTKLKQHFEQREITCANFLEIDKFDLESIYNLIPKLDLNTNKFNYKELEEVYDLLKKEDIVFRDFIRNRLDLLEEYKIKYISETLEENKTLEIPDYTQDLLPNVLRFIQRRERHNQLLKELL